MKTDKYNPPPIFVASGGRGIAGNNMVQSLLIQYPDNNMEVVICPDITTEEQVYELVIKAKREGAIIAHTMVIPWLRKKFNELGKEHGVRTVDFMGQLADCFDEVLHIKPLNHPGLYRELNAQYFDRIESIEFTLAHDDGMSPQRLQEAEIVLTGVSRAGKTPLSVYLAMYGWKVANVPLVKTIPPPEELFMVDKNRVFGLHIGLPQLVAHRKKRIQGWNSFQNDDYINEKSIQEDIKNALWIFEKGGFTVINVNNKPIETTANEIINLMSKRFQFRGRKLNSPYPDDVE